MSTSLAFILYTTSTNKRIDPDGLLVFKKRGEIYQGTVDVRQPVILTDAPVTGREIENQAGLTIIQFSNLDEDDDKLEFTLVQNPYERRLSFAGNAAIGSNIYSVSTILD